MVDPAHKTPTSSIRHLPDNLINQIAAGEVIERPAAAVKELLENAIDAGATRIDIDIRNGGKSLISIRDNGHGMGYADLSAALARHATSKLSDDDLTDIRTLGFRGEALASIAAVARLKVTSRQAGAETGWTISAEAGHKDDPRPAGHPQGTHIEVRDLFYPAPARLKFLKSDKGEATAVKEAVLRLALAHPDIAITLRHNDRQMLASQPGQDPAAMLDPDFTANSIAIDSPGQVISISGRVSLPTWSRSTARHQYLFVNGRPVRDKMLNGALRAAYADVLARDRHPLAVIFIDVPTDSLDVNVHPAKAEVRFTEPQRVRAALIASIQHALREHGHISAPGLGESVRRHARIPQQQAANAPRKQPSAYRSGHDRALNERVYQEYAPSMIDHHSARKPEVSTDPVPETDDRRDNDEPPLGTARAQLHENYIIAQRSDGLVLVDQHAAHERIVYEQLKEQLADNGVAAQGLLTPEIIELDEGAIDMILSRRDTLQHLGLELERFGNGALAVRSLPALIADKLDIAGLVRDLVDQLKAETGEDALQDAIMHVLATKACHYSIRAGRRLSLDEMNALLRQMEVYENTGQCNHGRPSYIALGLEDIEKLFGRR